MVLHGSFMAKVMEASRANLQNILKNTSFKLEKECDETIIIDDVDDPTFKIPSTAASTRGQAKALKQVNKIPVLPKSITITREKISNNKNGSKMLKRPSRSPVSLPQEAKKQLIDPKDIILTPIPKPILKPGQKINVISKLSNNIITIVPQKTDNSNKITQNNIKDVNTINNTKIITEKNHKIEVCPESTKTRKTADIKVPVTGIKSAAPIKTPENTTLSMIISKLTSIEESLKLNEEKRQLEYNQIMENQNSIISYLVKIDVNAQMSFYVQKIIEIPEELKALEESLKNAFQRKYYVMIYYKVFCLSNLNNSFEISTDGISENMLEGTQTTDIIFYRHNDG